MSSWSGWGRSRGRRWELRKVFGFLTYRSFLLIVKAVPLGLHCFCVCSHRAGGADSPGRGAGAGEKESEGGGGEAGEREDNGRGGEGGAGQTGRRPVEEPGATGACLSDWCCEQFQAVYMFVHTSLFNRQCGPYRHWLFDVWSQAAELAEFTAKIALLEDAKRKKEDEASEWQHKVTHSSPLHPAGAN